MLVKSLKGRGQLRDKQMGDYIKFMSGKCFQDKIWILVDQRVSTVADLHISNMKHWVHKRVCQCLFIPFHSNKVLKKRSKYFEKSQYIFMHTFQQPYCCDKHLTL